MSTRPDARDASATNAATASRSRTSTTRAWHAPPAAWHSDSVSRSSSASTSQAHTTAPRPANARLMARPKPCAAPVTMAVLPLKSRFMRRPSGTVHASAAGQRLEVVERQRTLAALDLVNQRHQARGERRRHAGRRRPASPRCRAARRPRSAACAPPGRARCRCASWPTGGCARPARRATRRPRPPAPSADRPRDRSRRTPRAAPTGRRRRRGSRAPARCRAAVRRHGQGIGDRLVGERRGEEHRAVGFLAPEVAPDVGA